jgi:lipopolysaccharide transport system ATP-binding protein
LEVGTGFHPELTGRENIYLNGAILGMKKREIDGKFDEIVAFSEVEKFIDTPVKRYSSGMYTKLAFAVAAHLESEILVVDEVLAVGDFSFQRKCLGKMDDVARQGRTILFVSHSLSSVQNLCTEGLVLNEGTVMFYGKIGEAIEKYIGSVTRNEYGFANLSTHPGRSSGMPAVIKSIGIRSNDEMTRYREVVMTGEDLVFEVRFDTVELTLDYAVIGIDSASGDRICTVGTHLCQDFRGVMRGKGVLECRIPHLPLRDGEYTVKIAVGRQASREVVDGIDNAIQFKVELGNYFGTGQTLLFQQGPLAQRSQWQVAL